MQTINHNELRRELESLAEPEFQKFSSALIPNIPAADVLGVRLPRLRKIAMRIAKQDWRAYLLCASDESFEEIMLQGMVIGYAGADVDEILTCAERFLPKINNWSVCDSFCTGLKIAKDYPEEMWRFVENQITKPQEYHIRFAVVMLLSYYVEEVYLHEIFAMLESVRHDSYYVKMAVAWALSICYVSYPDQTLNFLKLAALDDFTYRKTVQKICESRQVAVEKKKEIQNMKRTEK